MFNIRSEVWIWSLKKYVVSKYHGNVYYMIVQFCFVFLENTYAITNLWCLQEKCKNVYSNSKFVFKRNFNSKVIFNLRRCLESSQHHGVLKIELVLFIFSFFYRFCSVKFSQSNICVRKTIGWRKENTKCLVRMFC